jgi:hypothetical protein
MKCLDLALSNAKISYTKQVKKICDTCKTAELNVSAAHVDQQDNRISGQLCQELKIKDDEFDAKAKQGFLVIEHQIENQGKIKAQSIQDFRDRL